MGVFNFTYFDPSFNTILTNVTYMSGDGICTIASTVVTIGNSAFQNVTTTLTGVDLSTATGLLTIENDAFSGCAALTSVNIGNSVTSIVNRAFQSCSALTSVTIPNNVTTIGNFAFAYCSSLTSATIGTSVTSIVDAAFIDCSDLTSITIPDSVTNLGESAFQICSALTSVTFSGISSVTSLGNYVFNSCSALTSITIPDSVTSLGNGAFEYCSALPSIIIPEFVTSLGSGAFYSCTALTSVTIPDSVTSLGDGAFQICSALTSVTFSGISSVTSLSNYVFNSCTALTSVTIPDSVTSIGDGCLDGCISLPSITIPISVTSIGTNAFISCSALTFVQIDNQEDIATLGTTVFNAFGSFPSKTVLFYETANYAALTNPIGRNIAAYFSATPSTETNTITYNASPACFNEDTKILSLNKDGEEEYIPIQNLRKGDIVKSYLHGYRKIDLIGKGKMFNDSSKFTRCMYLFEKTDHNDLIEDLIVTGGHSILVDQLTDQEQLNQSTVWDRNYKIDDKVLLLAAFSSLFKPITKQKIFTWYHFTLEGEDDDQRFGVFANGVLVEIPSKNQFHQFNIQEII